MLSKTSWLLLGLLLLGVFLNWLHFAEPLQPGHEETLQQTVQNILHGLGEAFVIAAILGVVVDQGAKTTLVEEVIKNVSGHIIGQYLPTELRDPILAMLENRVVRKDWKIRYEVEEVTSHAEYLKLTTISTYMMENRANDAQLLPVTYDVEKSLSPGVGDAVIEYVRGRETNGDNFLDYHQNMMNDDRLKDSGDVVTFTDEVVVPGNGSYRVEFRSTEFVRLGSILPFFAKRLVVPPCELRIKNQVERLRAFVDASFCQAGPGKPDPDEAGVTKWSFDKPMLSGQGFTVRFSKG